MDAGAAPRGRGFLVTSRPLRYALLLGFDGLLTAASLYAAFFARFEGRIPPGVIATILPTLAVLLPIRIGMTLLFGLHRWSFRLSGLNEAVRLGTATFAGSAGFVAVYYFFQRIGPPRSVILLEFFLTSAGMAVVRFSPRFAAGWYVDQRRSRQVDARRTVIVGAGSAGDLLLRDLYRSSEHSYRVIGFVDDDARKIGTSLGGRPVLGRIDDLPAVIEKHGVVQVLIAIPRLSSERIQAILRLCSSLKVHFKIIPVSFTYLNEKVTASMLHDLSPEDLLPRDPNVFDQEEIGRLVSGRRILVTGAGGSIGGEIARQVSRHGCGRLVLVDMNENDLYFLYRELKEQRPDLEVYAEVADVREAARLLQLGALHEPEVVFHAAAHKHVPLMEDAPEEAVKNNVFGTANAARMAEACGADRFVLISTDKAVYPSSIMGVSKRVAELVVRDIARTSRTHFTAVRFGNVLGSAGSVVPLFKRQIERGGPVTVTHPDCRRYFMTISEAVSLVLLAGLGDYGELCVLDMGQPIKIVDLASHMITMAGLVPGVEIQIEFTGLRPGEKLSEELMTEEEERTQVVRNRILAARSPAPPAEIRETIGLLRRQAESSDREGLLSVLRRLVPTYSATRNGEQLPPPEVTAAWMPAPGSARH
jgi:FlaA1/EpsC-like NDP-sugar epimerase